MSLRSGINFKLLGTGSYGSVYRAKKKGTKIVRAVKLVTKKKIKDTERFK